MPLSIFSSRHVLLCPKISGISSRVNNTFTRDIFIINEGLVFPSRSFLETLTSSSAWFSAGFPVVLLLHLKEHCWVITIILWAFPNGPFFHSLDWISATLLVLEAQGMKPGSLNVLRMVLDFL